MSARKQMKKTSKGRRAGMHMKLPAAGILPYCIEKETGIRFVLFGSQAMLQTEKSKGSYNLFWGFRDYTDRDSLHTAAREGAEESVYCLGRDTEVEEILRKQSEIRASVLASVEVDTTSAATSTTTAMESVDELFPGCFMLCLGILPTDVMRQIVRCFEKRRHEVPELKRSLTHCEREMQAIRWIEASEIREVYQRVQKEEIDGRDAEGEYWRLRRVFSMKMRTISFDDHQYLFDAPKSVASPALMAEYARLGHVWQTSESGSAYLKNEMPSHEFLIQRHAENTSRCAQAKATLSAVFQEIKIR